MRKPCPAVSFCFVLTAVACMFSLSPRAHSQEPRPGGVKLAQAEPELPARRAPKAAPTRELSPRAIPRLVKFSGVLRNSLGEPRTGVVGILFALYEEQDGGAPLWLETQNVTLDEQGRYSVLLGATQSEGLPLELFASGEARWLGIQVQGEAEQPRILLVSVPYALKAEEAERLAGRTASEFVLAERLREEVQAQVEQQVQSLSAQAGLEAKTLSSGGGPAPAIVDGASTFTDSNATEVVLVTQNGTGFGLRAVAQNNVALYGDTSGAANIGVLGYARSLTGTTQGVRGQADSATGIGIFGLAPATTGANYGVRGQTNSTGGTGVLGLALATSGSNIFGLRGETFSPGANSIAVFGFARATTGPVEGVRGQTVSTSGTGVFGLALATSGSTRGVYGSVESASGTPGVFQNSAGGKLLSAISGPFAGTEVFSVDGAGNVAATGNVTAVGVVSGGSTVASTGSFTGNVSASQLVSTVADGTAPLVVTSTTQVPNLNASLLGGLAPSAFGRLNLSNTYQSSPLGTVIPQVLGAVDVATVASGFNSNPTDLTGSAFDSDLPGAVAQTFRWQAEPVGNNSPTPSGRLSLLFGQGGAAPTATGFWLNADGTINFAPGQTFPGAGGDITAVNTAAASGLTGGAASGDVSLGLLTSCAAGQLLKWNGAAWGCAGDIDTDTGDNISVNGTAVADADFDDTTPAVPAGAANVRWQRDAAVPNNISAYLQDVAIILCRAATQFDVVNTATEQTVFTCTVPANALATTKSVRVELRGDFLNNTGATPTLTLRIRFGATTIYADASATIPTSGSRRPFTLNITLANQNAANTQVLSGLVQMGIAGGATTGIGNFGTDEIQANTPLFGTAAEDTTVDRDIVITIQHSVASANLSFRRQYAKVVLE